MSNDVLLGDYRDFDGNDEILRQMFSFRHKIFNQRLGWAVTSFNGMERDAFDDRNPTYIVSSENGRAVNGCWRFLPTTGPYMLKDVFPELLRGEKAPCSPYVLEVSRFAVDSITSVSNEQLDVSPITMAILRTAYEHAVDNDVERFVAVTSVAMERFLKRIGIPMHRFGDGEAMKVGGVLSVACWININEQFYRAVYPQQYQEAA